MSNVAESLQAISENIDGFIGAALVDFDGGLTLGTIGGGDGLDLDVAGAGNLEVVRAQNRVMKQLGLDDEIEDIVITLGQQYHLIRMLKAHSTVFLYLALDRQGGNLGLARHQLRRIESSLEI